MASLTNNVLISFLLFSLSMIIPTLHAFMSKPDYYWEEKVALGQNYTEQAYRPDPRDVIDELNTHTHRVLIGMNNNTRSLRRKYSGACMATNPIDSCWRCDANWAKNRKRLADCALGFGKDTIGGRDGKFYLVTDHTDDNVQKPKPGTLRHAVIQNEPLWIIFSRNMIICLQQELIITSNKTIDGRGVQVRIIGGAGLMIQFVRNIIIHGIYIHNIIPKGGGMIASSVDHVGLRGQSDGDGISIFGSSNIWIDHVSMRRTTDGLLDVIQGSTAITISNSLFTEQNDVMLFGASDDYQQDKKMQITLAFNRFGHGMLQRMPHIRFGFVHIVNNDYTSWRMYAIGGCSGATIISQGNRFFGPHDKNAKQVTKREDPKSVWEHWPWRSQGDLFLNGAYFVESGDSNPVMPPKEFLVPSLPGRLVPIITRFVGALSCRGGKPC